MKKLIWILLICGMVMSASVDYKHAYVNASISNMQPIIAEPGKDVSITIRATNIGTGEAWNISVEGASEILTLKKGNCRLSVDRLWPDESVGKDCEFVVDPDAVSGDYKLYLTTRFSDKYENEFNVQTGIDIYVRGTPRFEIEKIKTEPERVAPGDSFKLYLDVKNVGSGDARDLYFNLSSSSFVVMPARVFLEEINMNETKTIEFDVRALKNASAIVHSTPLHIDYMDETMESASTYETVAIDLSGRAKLTINSITFSPEDYGAGDRVDMNITVKNEGGDAENAQVCINSDLFSRQCYYLGKIDGKSTSIAMFTYEIPGNASAGGKGYPMMIELKSDNFNEARVVRLVLRDKRADLKVSRIKTSPEILYSNSRATFEIRIENYGYGEARNVRVKIKLNEKEFESIVGRIYGEDRANANFYIPEIKSSGVIDIPVEINYEDSAGFHTVYDKTQITVHSSGGGFSITAVIFLIILAGVGYLFRKRIIDMVKGR